MSGILELLRVRQWVKNAFVFLPIIFSGNLFTIEYWYPAIVVFFSFSFVASSIYCINDIKDVEADRRHPKKRLRPIASGRVGKTTAYVLTVCLLLCSSSLLLFLPPELIWKCVLIEGCYFVLNLLYCFLLKRYAIIDVSIIAFGFVLRLVDGGIACGIWVSPWIVCMTFLITLFIAFAKRRDDLLIDRSNGDRTPIRKSSESYNLDYLNLILGVLGAVTIVCYLMYCMAPDTIQRFQCGYVYITFVFVLIAILRYLMLAVVRGESGSPTDIALHDRFIQLCVLAWIVSFALIIYT